MNPEAARLERIGRLIREEMDAAGGTIPFVRFMEAALYTPGDGYYEHDAARVGIRGDFYTSVSVGPLFGELLAFQFLEWAEAADETTVQWVEAGAHDGRLAADILGWIGDHRPAWRHRIRYVICEPSPVRRRWQEERLAPFAGCVEWTDTLPETRGVIFSNELLDAFPLERFGWDGETRVWFRWGVGRSGPGFAWCRMPMPEELCGFLPDLPTALLDVLPDGFTWECSPIAERWWSAAAQALRQGWLVSFDYGLTEMEFFTPGRTQGTLRGYRSHRHVEDVLADPGAADLTANVNFTRLEWVGEAAGLTTTGLAEQRQFLTRVMSRTLTTEADFGEWTQPRVRQFQTLTHPQHLGRSFRVLVQGRGVATASSDIGNPGG